MIRSPRRPLGWVGVVIAFALTLAACTPSNPQPPTARGSSAAAPLPTKVLNIGATAQPLSLDPSTDSGAAIPFVLLYNVYETLLKPDGKGGYTPLLAKKWDVSEDRLTYTFHLAEATFASGTPVNAEAVVKSLRRVKAGAPVLEVLTKQMAPVETITATDDKTVTIKLSQPSNDWLYAMASTAGIIYDPAATDLKKQPAGSGPFLFKEWRKGESLTLARNDAYWSTPTTVRGAVFRYYSDPNAMTTAMLAGQLDIVSNLTSPDAIGQFSDPTRYAVLEGRTSGEVVLGFNHSAEAMKDLKVRQAINYAIDRKALLNAVWGGKGDLIGSMVPPFEPWYEDLSQAYPYDPEKAKALLAEAGHSGGLTLRLRVPTLPYATAAGQYITSQLKAVGINVTLDELEFPARWLDQVYQKADYDMTIVAHVEPRDLDRFANPGYYWRYDNAEFRRLYAEADAATPEQQATLLKQAAKLLSDDAAADWLWLLPNIVITTTEISGVSADAMTLSFDLTRIAAK